MKKCENGCNCLGYKEAKEKYGHIKLKENWSESLEPDVIIAVTQIHDTKAFGKCAFCRKAVLTKLMKQEESG